MNIGKLYQAKNYYWFLYPSKDKAATAATTATTATAATAEVFAYYSTYFNCNVSYISPNSIFCLLEKDGEFIKILSTNGEVGWIYLSDFYKDDDIKEVNQ
jgi:hypothetical protein